MILHKCLCGIIDRIKNAEMTKINGVVITESQLFDFGSEFSFSVSYETKATGEQWKERGI